MHNLVAILLSIDYFMSFLTITLAYEILCELVNLTLAVQFVSLFCMSGARVTD